MSSTPKRGKRKAPVKKPNKKFTKCEIDNDGAADCSSNIKNVAKKAKIEKTCDDDFIKYDDNEFEEDFQDDFDPNSSLLIGQCCWKVEDVVGQNAAVNPNITQRVITLLNENCTIPFIARYRADVTGGLDADKLRDIQDAYESLKMVQKKAENVAKTLNKEGKLDPSLSFALSNCTTLNEVEYWYAPLKSGSKRSLAERAKQLGLEESAQNILAGMESVSRGYPNRFVNPEIKELENVDKVLSGWQHIIASIVSKDKEVLDCIRKLCKDRSVMICAKKSPTATKKDNAAHIEGKSTQSFKFENYFDFEFPVKTVKPHQILALNRGESLKILTVKITIPENIKTQVLSFCQYHWPNKLRDPETAILLNKAYEDAYERLLAPLISRQTRSQLTKTAEKESIAVFASNLKHLLLTPPVRGHTICGIDPGFVHGCKLAIVSPTGEIQATDVLYIHGKIAAKGSGEAQKLKQLLQNFRCEKIALGNGTACRETEMFLSDLIKKDFFKPLNVQYCIINESGVSIYSVTKEAAAEMPQLIPNLRSAVSLARRLQDPLLEYVKVEPKHIGVGMYQHDISEKLLKTSLNDVMIECVSFVGVDLNVSSEVVLGKIAGLTAAKVKSIIAWRELNGGFRNRQQLLLVKGLGPKAYEQCAGFVKILPETSQNCLRAKLEVPLKAKRKAKDVDIPDTPNPFDMTIIHPESYDVAHRLLKVVGIDISEIGTEIVIKKVKDFVSSQGIESLAEKAFAQVPTMKLICDALQQPLEIDIRATFEKPLFRMGVLSMEDLKVNQVVTGRVANSTHFGAFVDIGVGNDGLIHTSGMSNQTVALGDIVQVQVLDIDAARGRISLRLLSKDGQQVASALTSTTDTKPQKFQASDSKPFLKREEQRNRQMCSLDKLVKGTTVDGTVKNVCKYGVFVDIGAKRDGLIHQSNMCGQQVARYDKVTVRILNVDIPRQRISLKLESR